MPPSDDEARKLRDAAEALDRVIAEAQRTKVLVESRLRAIRQAGRPAPFAERRKAPRKTR